jgi:hypothetical protein
MISTGPAGWVGVLHRVLNGFGHCEKDFVGLLGAVARGQQPPAHLFADARGLRGIRRPAVVDMRRRAGFGMVGAHCSSQSRHCD